MRSFGLQFTDPDGQGSLKHRKAAQERKVFVYNDTESGNDTAFQKGLAYWSYYTLVFTTFCTLTPGLIKQTATNVVTLLS